MNRKQFITMASSGAIAISSAQTVLASLNENQEWQPDGNGNVALFGVLAPESDYTPESELWAMAPLGVSVVTARVKWDLSIGTVVDQARAFAEPPHIDNAIQLFARLKLKAALYPFTGSSYVMGAEADDPLRLRLEKQIGGVPVILTCQAATEALRKLNARKIAVIHPPWFTDGERNAKGKNYFVKQGFDVLFCEPLTPARRYSEILPQEVFEYAKTNMPEEADALFIGGNGLRCVGAIQALEKELSKPILTANQVLMWAALKRTGIISTIKNYGKIFTI